MTTATLTVERGAWEEGELYDCIEVEVEVAGTVTAVIPGRTGRAPEDCYEAEGGEVELQSAEIDGHDVLAWLTDDERRRAEQALFEAAGDYDET